MDFNKMNMLYGTTAYLEQRKLSEIMILVLQTIDAEVYTKYGRI